MHKYSNELINSVRLLRSQGSTYGEIQNTLKRKIPKSTLYEWCKSTPLPITYPSKVLLINKTNLEKAHVVALAVNRAKREQFLNKIKDINSPVAKSILDLSTAKIALAMLCLGEASKYSKKTRSFSLGSSDPRIITLFIELLKRCFKFDIEKVRCTVQCRADQDIEALEEFWRNVTQVPRRLFYNARIDPRTIGKPTLKVNYKGVLRVDYFDTKVQLELESLSDLVYNQILQKGPEV